MGSPPETSNSAEQGASRRASEYDTHRHHARERDPSRFSNLPRRYPRGGRGTPKLSAIALWLTAVRRVNLIRG